jgi:hypothetical protein
MQKTSDKSSHKSRIIAEDRNFKKYLEETLQVEDLRKKRKQNKISEPEEKEIKRNDDKKVYFLDKFIFGSMANLIYFFRFMLRHPELIKERFGEDIEELLALKQDSNTGDSLGFSALINLILKYPLHSGKGLDIYQYLNDADYNFKRHLLPILQDCIYAHTTNIMIHREENMLFKMMVDNDFQRAMTWTRSLDKETKHAHKATGRKIIVSDGAKKR